MMYWFSLTLFLLLGLGLSGVYFAGLWMTVQRVRNVQRPTLLLLGSFLVRAAIVLVGFYLIIRFMDARWEALGLALLGFMVGRWVLIRRWKPKPISPPRST